MKCKKTFAIAGILVLASFNALTAQPTYRSLKQPDGTTFQAIERGDEWLHFFETPEGYVVRRGDDGYFHYFNINALGDFVATDLKVGIDPPVDVNVRPYENPGVLRALQRKIDTYNAAAEVNRQRYLQKQRSVVGSVNALNKGSGRTTLSTQQTVQVDVGLLLVEFNGRPHYTSDPQGSRPNGYTVNDFETMFFSDDTYDESSPDGEDVFGSLRDYFEFQSHGILTITGQVINPSVNGIPTWLNMGNSAPYNTLGESDDLLEDAINRAVADSGWNCNYDVIAVLVSQDDWTWYQTGVAWFQSSFSSNNFPPSFDFTNWFGGYVFNERNAAEYRDSDEATFSHIGINCHELFHVLGWGIPNILNQGTLIWAHSGSGDWSSMSVGYRTGPLRKTESPGDLDPIARILMEWAVPTGVTTNLDDESITYIEEDANLNETFDFYRLTSSYSIEEFIVENRQYSGFNSYLPEWWKSGNKGGLLVWRHASSTSQTRSLRRADNDNEVVLEGMPHVSDGDLGDPFPGASNNREITPYTTPSTNPYAYGTFTGVAVTDISNSDTTMTADLCLIFHQTRLKI